MPKPPQLRVVRDGDPAPTDPDRELERMARRVLRDALAGPDTRARIDAAAIVFGVELPSEDEDDLE